MTASEVITAVNLKSLAMNIMYDLNFTKKNLQEHKISVTNSYIFRPKRRGMMIINFTQAVCNETNSEMKPSKFCRGV